MEKPTITIEGVTRELPNPKARLWRDIVKFEEERKELTIETFCEEHVKKIAEAFGVTEAEVYDNLDADEILPTYLRVMMYVMSLLTSKLKVSKKNEEIEEQT